MLLLAFERALFKFNARTPALAPLFQLPPRIGRRGNALALLRFNPAADHSPQLII